MRDQDTTAGAGRSSGRGSGSGFARGLVPWIAGMMLLFGLPSLFPDLVRRAAPLLLYHPTALPAARSAPAEWGLPRGEEVSLRADDGVALHGWWIPTAGEAACGTLLYFHGNAGNVAGRAGIAGALSGRGLNVFLLDYRGFGRSQGKPSEEGLYRDAEAAYRHLTEEREIPPRDLVVAGHSLGGAVAAYLASRRPAGAVALTSTFEDLSAIARSVYPWLPDAWFDWDPVPFPTLARMGSLGAPVLVGRGSRDELIPASQVRTLYRSAPEPRAWVQVPDADHGGLWFHEAFQDRLLRFLEDHFPGCRTRGAPDPGA